MSAPTNLSQLTQAMSVQVGQHTLTPPTGMQIIAASAFFKVFKHRVGHPQAFVGKFAVQLLTMVEKGIDSPIFSPPLPPIPGRVHEPLMVVVDYPPATDYAQHKEHITTREAVVAGDRHHFRALNDHRFLYLAEQEKELINLHEDDLKACFKNDDTLWERSATINHTTIRNESGNENTQTPRNLDPGSVLVIRHANDIEVPILDPSYLFTYIICNRNYEPLTAQVPYLLDWLVRNGKYANLRHYVCPGTNSLPDEFEAASAWAKLDKIYKAITSLRVALEGKGKEELIQKLKAVMDETDTQILTEDCAKVGIVW